MLFAKIIKLLSIKFPPLSVRKHLMDKPVSFSTCFLKHLNMFKAADFSLKKYIHAFLLKSSIKHNEYLFLLLEIGEIGPQMSACISCNRCVALHVLLLEIGLLCCFPRMQAVHVTVDAGSCGRPWIMFLACSNFKPLWLKCPYLQCQR
jgi:hypothetical protein